MNITHWRITDADGKLLEDKDFLIQNKEIQDNLMRGKGFRTIERACVDKGITLCKHNA